jgi:hypothetical protein
VVVVVVVMDVIVGCCGCLGVPETFEIEQTAAVEWLQMANTFSSAPGKLYCLRQVSEALQSCDANQNSMA